MSKPTTIAGDGSTILNVYYSRKWYEVKFYSNDKFTCGKEEHEHNWICNITGCTKEEHTHTDDCRELVYSIKAKYGANISKDWPTIDGSSEWRTSPNGSTYQANIDTMPLDGAKFYGPVKGDGRATASYYVEALPGDKVDKIQKGIEYTLYHQDTSTRLLGRVSEEDQYPITGFDFVEDISTKTGQY